MLLITEEDVAVADDVAEDLTAVLEPIKEELYVTDEAELGAELEENLIELSKDDDIPEEAYVLSEGDTRENRLLLDARAIVVLLSLKEVADMTAGCCDEDDTGCEVEGSEDSVREEPPLESVATELKAIVEDVMTDAKLVDTDAEDEPCRVDPDNEGSDELTEFEEPL